MKNGENIKNDPVKNTVTVWPILIAFSMRMHFYALQGNRAAENQGRLVWKYISWNKEETSPASTAYAMYCWKWSWRHDRKWPLWHMNEHSHGWSRDDQYIPLTFLKKLTNIWWDNLKILLSCTFNATKEFYWNKTPWCNSICYLWSSVPMYNSKIHWCDQVGGQHNKNNKFNLSINMLQ